MPSDAPPRRLTFPELMGLIPLPSADGGHPKRYMGTRAAWLPGSDLPLTDEMVGPGKPLLSPPAAAYGGHVYAQAGLAVCRAYEELARDGGGKGGGKGTGTAAKAGMGLHSIHGYFTAVGFTDRPFVYEASLISAGRSFATAQVSARQPTRASQTASRYVEADATASPLGPVCFTAVVALKAAEPHSEGITTQAPSAQARFAAVLASRRPDDWPPAPPADVDAILAALGRHIVGAFPLVHTKKVDMRPYNAGRPVHDRRELLLYRLQAPLPAADANAHVLVHAYEADRNGLLMAGNHLGFRCFAKFASLSYSIVVHCNADDAIMHYGPDQWWIHEWSMPRSAAGRVMIVCKIWSPAGLHVATAYQDGLARAQKGYGPEPRI